MDIKLLQRDVSAREQGEWIKDIPNLGDIELKVRGLNSDTYRAFIRDKEKTAPLTDRAVGGGLKDEVLKGYVKEALYEVILLDWRNFESDGAQIPYSKEVAKELLENPFNELLVDSVVWAARVVDEGKAIVKDIDVKKSK